MTVAVPTRNRAELLRACLESVRAQTLPPARVVVLDNASTDATPDVARDLGVQRVDAQANLGMRRNWNRAFEVAETEYLCVFGDDDVMEPAFLERAVAALDEHPGAGFVFTAAELIGAESGRFASGDVVAGCVPGLDYLERVVAGRAVVIHPSTVLMRTAAADEAGRFDSPHSGHTFDFNLYLRLAARHDVVHLDDALVRLLVHPGQESSSAWRAAGATGPYADVAERIDAATYLLASERADERAARRRLADRIRALNARRSDAALHLVPALASWEERVGATLDEVRAVVPSDATLVLIDDGEWGPAAIGDRRAVPFADWGAPADDAAAIDELERLRAAGAAFAVVGWPAFWWLDCYDGFARHLRRHYRSALENSRVVVYDLR